MNFGLLLPGQGAQAVSMGADFAKTSPTARNLFSQADEVLGFSLSKLCFEGPLEELTKTDVAQPAIYVTSLSVLAAIEERHAQKIQPLAAAGLSLGEYTALSAAGALTFEDGLRLVRLRGSAMQEAAEALPSGMTSVMGMELENLTELCSRVSEETGAICQVANLNSPGQIVVSGQNEALDVFDLQAKEAGARRAMRLNVAGAFHSEVMRPASVKLNAALEETEFSVPNCPVWQNATGLPESDPTLLKENLVAQLCSPVLWENSFRDMAQTLGQQAFLEPAPGKVLAALARKINREATVHSADSAEAIENLLDVVQ